jgi:HSP20 family protein
MQVIEILWVRRYLSYVIKQQIMSLALRTPTIPSILKDWTNPESMLMRDFFDLGSDFVFPRVGMTIPSVNIQETPKDFIFELAAPGLERKDFNIELDNHVLTISSEKEEKKDEKENGYYRKEYSFNSFKRSFTLPENVKEANIDAKYENGILKVVVPKVKETISQAPKKIAVG